MPRKTLGDVIGPKREAVKPLRWETTVPIGTNLFMLMELFQFAFVGAAIAVLLLCSGVLFTEGVVTMTEISAALGIGAMILGGTMAGFVAMAFIFFGNRYFAVYRMDEAGVYHEGSRGHDASGKWFSFGLKPYPVQGEVTKARTRSRHLFWEKVDRFQSIPSMRVIVLRRGFWHLLRLYLPDAATYEQAVAFLKERLRET